MGTDFLVLCLAFLLAYLIRTNIDIRPLATPTEFYEYLRLVLFIAPMGIIIFFFNGLYDLKIPVEKKDELKKIFVAVSTGIMIIIALDFVKTKHIFPAKSIPIYGWILAITFIFISRQILKEFQKYLFKYGIGVQRLIIIGANRLSHLILSEIKKNPYLGYRIIGIIDERKAGEEILGFKISSNGEKLETILKAQKVDEIIQANPQLSSDEMIRLINLSDRYKIGFKFAPSLFGVYTNNTHVSIFAGVPVVELKRTPLEGWGRIEKRIMDFTGSLFVLVIFSPIMITIAVLNKITSKGPVFYKHKRLGRFGKEFKMYKFRTMKTEYCIGENYGGGKAKKNFKEIQKNPKKKAKQYIK